MKLQPYINKRAKEFNSYAKTYLKKNKHPSLLWKAMNYGLSNGGKRIRPLLIIEFSKVLKLKKNNYMRVALATELVHSYSLIHDDIMDDDNIRRGKPTTHKKFDQATAILAGNSLLTLAFEILADKKTHLKDEIRANLILQLAFLSGHKGLAGGQSLDLLYEKKNATEKNIINMHELKTAKLFEFCSCAPLIMSNVNDIEILKQAQKYGKNFGLIFQATDDLIDVIGNKVITGKETQKDFKKNKGNIFKYKTQEEIKEYCTGLATKATSNSTYFSCKDSLLYKLIFNIINRVT
ncbi:MAG: polyprenyl synthetase family protein [Pelagibacterales bacterium]|nr:polyprenyl synthetase family protein [Pelagibacterales bacterium]